VMDWMEQERGARLTITSAHTGVLDAHVSRREPDQQESSNIAALDRPPWTHRFTVE